MFANVLKIVCKFSMEHDFPTYSETHQDCKFSFTETNVKF